MTTKHYINSESIQQIPGLIKELYKIINKLESIFPGRKFTPDGHLVGSIGEVLAAHHYKLELLPNSTEGHDAKTRSGDLVQIKATQKRRVALRSEPDNLLVLQIKPDGTYQEIYYGSGKAAWSNAGKMQKNGQRPISLSKLQTLARK